MIVLEKAIQVMFIVGEMIEPVFVIFKIDEPVAIKVIDMKMLRN